ncbi:tyrosine-type recombinase/integrase [Mycobacterium sp. 852002-51057_SCH5723018]|uniref:tyrosine-type recombinase/integrase n=1 Tax=Mycobacterium sp. 852002-51057_SCH5723018 TaxID=1834094 RepID=UPI000B254450|nr:tyrosine-type recombinase/integrase [Mycobacterium sp. 852002-51057_SCH5723018]
MTATVARLTPRLDFASLLGEWEIAMKCENKSKSTLHNYVTGVRVFVRWCEDNGQEPALDRQLVRAWVADLLEGGAQASSAAARQLAVRRFSAWLAEEGEIDSDLLYGLRLPKLPRKVLEALSDAEAKRLIAVCSGPEFRDRRDEALIRLMLETGLRRAEVCALKLRDLNLEPEQSFALVRCGKGAKGRIAPFGPHTARALSRYLRARRTHPLHERDDLWLGDRGRTLGYDGVRFCVQYRAELAGIKDFHLHKLRRTFACRWLAAEGSEQGLMAVAGWTSHAMIARYTNASAAERAAAESRRLNLGEI